MHTLIVNRHVAWHLQDLNTLVICLADSWNGPGEAACIEGMICPAIAQLIVQTKIVRLPRRAECYSPWAIVTGAAIEVQDQPALI